MSDQSPGAGALDYFPCRYGGSRLLFRGPWRPVGPGHAVAIGGTATYGRFVAEPWPALLERATGRTVLNLGVPHSGPDAFLNEPDVLSLAAQAGLRFVQVPGAVNLSNPLYTVHPRRNDRFLAASPRLRRLYPEVDFMEFVFTRHMIRALAARGPQRFAELARVLGACWLTRMTALLSALGGPTVLVWLGERPPPAPEERPRLDPGTPLLVDAVMLRALAARASGLAEVVVPAPQEALAGKIYAPLEEFAARRLPGPAEHAAVAGALLPWMGR